MGETRKITRIRRIIYVSGLLISTMLLFVVLLFVDNSMLRILISAGAVAIPASAFAMDKVHNNYVDKLLISLSDLINTLINMKDEAIFTETEDNLLSKLQTQIIKLTGILKAHNNAIEKEKSEIQSLISDISHQLKTPIASVKLYGELLIETDITELERREYGDVLIDSLNKLTFLTESMIMQLNILKLTEQ